MAPTTFTPVTAETFAAFVERYRARISKDKEATKNAFEDKPTGKQIFTDNKNAFDDVVIDGLDNIAVAPVEEIKTEVEEEVEEFKYDRALYDPDALEEAELDDSDFD